MTDQPMFVVESRDFIVTDPDHHYDAGGIETLDIIKAKLTPEQYEGYLLGNALKYQCRMNFKTPDSPQRDAEKAANYSRYLAEFLAEHCNSDIPAPPKPEPKPEEKTADEAPEGATHYREYDDSSITYYKISDSCVKFMRGGLWRDTNDTFDVSGWLKELTPIT